MQPELAPVKPIPPRLFSVPESKNSRISYNDFQGVPLCRTSPPFLLCIGKRRTIPRAFERYRQLSDLGVTYRSDSPHPLRMEEEGATTTAISASLKSCGCSSILSPLRKKSESEHKPALPHTITQISSVPIRSPARKSLPPGIRCRMGIHCRKFGSS